MSPAPIAWYHRPSASAVVPFAAATPGGWRKPLPRQTTARALCAALLIGLFGGICPAQAASFACNAASAADETAICGSMALSDLDVKMATLYGVVRQLVAMGERGAIQDAQRTFLAKRSACGADAACLRGLYQARISALQSVIDRIAANGPY